MSDLLSEVNRWLSCVCECKSADFPSSEPGSVWLSSIVLSHALEVRVVTPQNTSFYYTLPAGTMCDSGVFSMMNATLTLVVNKDALKTSDAKWEPATIAVPFEHAFVTSRLHPQFGKTEFEHDDNAKTPHHIDYSVVYTKKPVMGYLFDHKRCMSSTVTLTTDPLNKYCFFFCGAKATNKPRLENVEVKTSGNETYCVVWYPVQQVLEVLPGSVPSSSVDKPGREKGKRIWVTYTGYQRLSKFIMQR